MRSLAGTDKKMTMELGGKAANIVFDDAPIDQAVEGIVNGIFFNQGHVCCAGSRLLVHEPVAAQVIAKLKNRIKVLRVGDPLDKNTDVGAINSKEQLAKIRELVGSGVKEGAEMFQPPCRLPAKGFYFRPTIFSGVTMSHRIAREEIFGPVLSILTFRTVDEAIEKANNTAYGLSAGVWTDKGSRILKMSTELKAGVVWANTYNKFDPDVALRRLQGKRLRPRGRPAGPARLLQAGLIDFSRFNDSCFKLRRNCPKIPSLFDPCAFFNQKILTMTRLPITKTPKCYVGGAFIRSESGRVFPLKDAAGNFFANIPQCTRKDLRNAVEAAAKAGPGWAKRTAYNRGQILYRLGEMLEARRRARWPTPSRSAARRSPPPRRKSTATIDRLIYYAGWADKYEQVLGNVNPVASPHFNFTVTEPMGIVGVLAPDAPPLLALVSLIAPAITERQHRRRARLDAAVSGHRARRNARDERPARRRGQPAHRLPQGTRADLRHAHPPARDQRRGERRRAQDDPARRGRQRQARLCSSSRRRGIPIGA